MLNPTAHKLMTALRDLDVALLNRRRQRLVVRTLWLALLAGILGVALRTWGGIPLTLPLTLAGVVGILLVGGLSAWRSRLHPGQLARVLDRSFGLDARLATALELGHRGIEDGFAPEVLRQANLALTDVEPAVLAQTALPLRLEWQTLGWMTLFALGLALILVTTRPLQTAAPAALPPLPELAGSVNPPLATAPDDPPASDPESGTGERPAQGAAPGSAGTTPAQTGASPALSPDAAETAAAIADALRDNGATRSAADALDRGDLTSAAAALRDLAGAADQLSDATRSELSDQLDQAANELATTRPEQASQLRTSADQLRAGGDQTAEGLDSLAQTVDDLASSAQAGQPGDPQNGAGGSGSGTLPGGQSRTNPEQLVPGQEDLPLPPAPPEAGPTTSGSVRGDASITLPGGSGGSSGGGSSGGGSVPDDLSDPSTIPPELRDAIQNYFNH